MKISTILDQVDLGSMALPEFQRGYVWNGEQVRGLTHSLYRKHPVGSLIVWVTKTETADAKGDGPLAPGSVRLLVDGQQRITSLYGIIRGKPPEFFEGNPQAFTGLHFHLGDETFEFYAPAKMKDNPLWISVTELMQIGAGEAIKRLVTVPELQSNLTPYINRLTAVEAIKETDLHIEEVTGEDKTVDVVVDIFNQVNRGGTKLSKGDLALAKICAGWPEARREMNKRLDKWKNAGFVFRLEWLLRIINAIVTGEALFSALKDIDLATFRNGLQQAEKNTDYLLNMIASRLGLDHDQVLGSRSSFPLLARYLARRGGHLQDHKERDRLLYWYAHTFLWGRYAGSTETVLNQDLALVEQGDGALDGLINQLRQNRANLQLQADDFRGWSRGARFYPLLYMLTRVCRARDWDSDVELSRHLLGNLSSLEVHHIFPKGGLYQRGYPRDEVNAIANFTFLTKETNLLISDEEPATYLERFARTHPGAVESHWIPMDRDLWKPENYREFLKARRELLAQAANAFLDSLRAGAAPEGEVTASVLERAGAPAIGGVETEEEERIIQECNEWVVQHGLPEGQYMYELADPSTGEPLGVIDLAWPNGLQEGYSEPVALLLNEGPEIEEMVNQAGFHYFTDAGAFRAYVEREVLALQTEGA